MKIFTGDTSISPSPLLNGSFGEERSKLNDKLSKEKSRARSVWMWHIPVILVDRQWEFRPLNSFIKPICQLEKCSQNYVQIFLRVIQIFGWN